jgi:Immunoglobulin I-set domain
MKKLPKINTTAFLPNWAKRIALPVLAFTSLATLAAHADTVIVSAYTGSSITANPPYSESFVWNASSLKSSAPGMNGSRFGSRFVTAPSPAVTVTPTLGVSGGVYLVELTHGSAGSISADVVMSISSPDNSCDIDRASTTAFQRTQGVNAWVTSCYITNHVGVTAPALTFTYLSGAIGPDQSANRVYFDGARFTLATDPCLSGPSQLLSINGPLAAGQTTVTVPGVDLTCTNVSVYADGVKIGSATPAASTNVVVTTSALVKGKNITATQMRNGVESCLPIGGFPVGGGSNPRIRVSFSLRQDSGFAGPIGTNGGTASPNIFFLGATGPAAGFGTAPLGGKVLKPTNDWQTVTFTNGVSSSYFWNGTGVTPVGDPFASLESIAVCLDDLPDSGPYNIYIDNIMNGTTVIQDFESATNSQNTVMFVQPSFSSTTSGYLLGPAPGSISPNVTQVTTNNADTGNNCLRVNWQFRDHGASDWLRLTASGSLTPNPEVDLTQPISVRILVLPVGTTTNSLSISLIPNAIRTNNTGSSTTFSVTARGAGPFTYQWQSNGVDIVGATLSSYTKNNLTIDDSGTYTVVVNNGHASSSTSAQLTVVEGVNPPGAITISYDGVHVTLSWAGTFTLQSATSVAGPYNDVSGPVTTAPYTTTATGGPVFYRLRN